MSPGRQRGPVTDLISPRKPEPSENLLSRRYAIGSDYPVEGDPQEMSFVDKSLTCRDCGTSFEFTIGEQEFYAEKGFTNEPSRCPSCRRANKARRQSDGGGYGAGNGGFAPRQDRPMYDAICSECGRETRVPFQPKPDRPVYCNDCFQSRRPQRTYDRY
jgi:CxxC-x17-CxxC domain-containing protein